jgi:hypothetical protein
MEKSFDNFRPGSWQEKGMLLEAKPPGRAQWRMLRSSEKWLTWTAASVVSGLLAIAVATSPSGFAVSSVNGASIRSATLSRTEAQFAADTAIFEVSPKLWSRLMAYVDEWPDLPDEQVGPEAEPFV